MKFPYRAKPNSVQIIPRHATDKMFTP